MNGAFLRNLLLFGRVLRALGLDVNPGRMIDLVTALGCISIGSRSDFYHAARGLLVHRREDIPIFDEAFEVFWRSRGRKLTSLDLRALGERRRFRKPRFVPPSLGEESAAGSALSSLQSDEPPVIQATLTYSEREVLRQKDFSDLTADELRAVQWLMAEIVWRVRERRTRRRRPGHGRLIDLRRTVRLNLRYGGELLDWAEREPKSKARPLVIIADVSGSMERYTRLLLLFTYGLAKALEQKVEAFVFSTRLTRITRQLRERNLDRALREVSRTVPDWSGGTRIGEALRTFNFEWGRRVLGSGALTLVISDGWDCGDIGVLRDEIARLQRSSRRLIWLNPLLGSPEYEPLTRGIQASLPFIDDFLPVHNLASLEDLAEHLANLTEHRPERRQIRVSRSMPTPLEASPYSQS
ncbi:MAG TPA: VWA domain-containing protein [Thermoanaerobaculia bacterium]|nr:VWA domain-containing protein [Thermoanaerobaculia bacterium]